MRSEMRAVARCEGGFILAVTLWLLAGIALAVGLMLLWAREQVNQAHIDSERLADEIGALETRDTLLYLMATVDFTRAGIPVRPVSEEGRAVRRLDEMGGSLRDPVGGELRLEGTRYEGRGGATFALQDEAGLLPLSWNDLTRLDRFLEFHGVNAERAPRLRDALLDYVDKDDLVRLEGAESREYRRAHRAPPPNRPLLLPSELSQVLGWDALPPEQLGRMASLVTPYYGGTINLNSVPGVLLPLWVPDCPDRCSALLARRAERALSNPYEVQALAQTRLEGDAEMDYRYLSDRFLRLDVWGRTGAGQRLHVELTALADQRGPWKVLAAYPITRPLDEDTAEPTDSDLLTGP